MKSNFKNLHYDLIEGCKKHDSKAQSKVYAIYYKAMYNTCLRIVKDSFTAEDIMQEAFISAFGKINSYSGVVTFGAWLKRIVINKSIDHLKIRKIEFLSLTDEHNIISDEIEPNETINFNINEIKRNINKLPDNYRIVLSLYLLEGYDHEEIGQILNIKATSSRSQLTRAKAKLIKNINNSMSHTFKK